MSLPATAVAQLVNEAELQSLQGRVAPAGAVTFSALAVESAPWWLLCNGQAVSRSTYSVLFAAIGTKYGAGDGATTFNLPDLRNVFLVGAGASFALDAVGGSSGPTIGFGNLPLKTAGANGSYVSTVGGDPTNGNSGPAPLNTLPPYHALSVLIATGAA